MIFLMFLFEVSLVVVPFTCNLQSTILQAHLSCKLLLLFLFLCFRVLSRPLKVIVISFNEPNRLRCSTRIGIG